MYASSAMMAELARNKQHDLITQAAKDRRARRVRKPAPVSRPSASRSTRRAWQLVPHLHPQAQA